METTSKNKSFLNALNKAIPFGKYKGLPLELVYKTDKSYLKWLLQEKENIKNTSFKTSLSIIKEYVSKDPFCDTYIFDDQININDADILNIYINQCDLNIFPEYLMHHQKIGLAISDKYDKFGFFLECGLGKTLMSIEIINRKKAKTLIVCPISVIIPAWISDFQQFRPEIKVCNLYPYSHNERLFYLKDKNDEYDVYIINYDGFKSLYNDLLTCNIDMLIVDESSKMKNADSQISKKLHKFAQKKKYVYLLSGTPAPNSPLEYFMQIDAISPQLLGSSYWAFRERYFFQPNKKQKWRWVMKKNSYYEILYKIKKTSIFISKNDVLDLPEKIFIKRYVEMTDKQKQMYNTYLLTLFNSIQDGKVDLPAIMKLRQITSGFIYSDEKETSPIQLSDNKFAELLLLLEEIGNKQVIIWANFKYEIKKIKSLLGNKAVVLFSEVSIKEKETAIELFRNNKVQYLIANPASAGHGLTFTNSSYAIYFSLNYSLELWLQSIDRIHRYGQVNRCTYYLLLVNNSIDTVIYQKLSHKQEISADILNKLKVIS